MAEDEAIAAQPEDIARAQPRVLGLIAQVERSARAGDPRSAARFAEAALRTSPENSRLMRLMGQAWLAAGEPDRAIEALGRASEARADPACEAALILAFLAAGRTEDALARLDSALATFAVRPGDALAEAATRVFAAAPGECPGWIGLDLDQRPWGEMRSGLGELDPDGATAAQVDVSSLPGHSDLARFVFASGWSGRASGRAEIQGRPLVGSAARPDFRLDGRATMEDGLICGWARLGWAPGAEVHLRLVDSRGNHADLLARQDPGDGEPGFTLDPRAAGLTGAQIEVSARLPDGTFARLPDSPVVVRLPSPPKSSTASVLRAAPASETVDIVIPAYEGLEDTLACIASVRATVGPLAEIVVIEDASPNPALVRALIRLAKEKAITLLRNPKNIGFPGAVNRGFALHEDRDVVVLNSDAEVFEGWLEGLRAAAYGGPDVGTVTALSNEGSIASYPGSGGECDVERAAMISRLARVYCAGLAVEAPTGVGFCMYVRRACLAETGPLDAALFGRGYAEENDFCRRAAARGWRHLIAPGVFVRHLGGRSFADQAGPLLERNLKLLNRRHGGYDALIQEFIRADPLQSARRTLDEIQLIARGARRALVVSLALTGGVARFVNERSEALREQGLEVLRLSPGEAPGFARLDVFGDPSFEDLIYGPNELAALRRLLARLGLGHIELQHFLDLDPAVIDATLSLGVPYDVYVHDYVWICPRITLIDDTGGYCEEPPVETCERCVAELGARLADKLTVAELRERSGRWLSGARSVIAPSRDAAHRLERHFPWVAFQVRPWEAPPPLPPGRRPIPGKRLRVALVGAIGEHKGYDVLLACARDARYRDLPLEFVVVGYSQDDDPLEGTGRVFLTGLYAEDEVDDLIAREAPDLALFASVWPETWCYALTVALRAGLPIAAFDLGAIAERLAGSAAPHELLPLHARASQINDRLLAMGARLALEAAPGSAYEASSPPRASEAAPSDSGARSMTTQQSPGALAVSGEILALAQGVYRFTVTNSAPRRVGAAGELVLPAMHVGTAPGAAPDTLEIMTGTRTDSAWLYEPNDLVLLKAKATPTLVLITSVRSPDTGALDIAVERLDQSASPRPVAPVPAAAPKPRHDADGRACLRAQLLVHVERKGDLRFADGEWAGAAGEGLAMEGLSILPLEGILPHEIEYRIFTAAGAEAPWVAGGNLAGSRGMAIPLTGLSARLRQGAELRYDCEYSARFLSGEVVGPKANGDPCRSTIEADPVTAVQISIVERTAQTSRRARTRRGPEPSPEAIGKDERPIGARFSIFREGAE